LACTGPIGDEHAQVLELVECYRATWGHDDPPAMPTHANLHRVLLALRDAQVGFEKCTAAIRGHHKLATKDGSKLGRGLRFVFPARKDGKNESQPFHLDVDRVCEFAHEAPGNGKSKRADYWEEPGTGRFWHRWDCEAYCEEKYEARFRAGGVLDAEDEERIALMRKAHPEWNLR
jgi:hypothetical protein